VRVLDGWGKSWSYAMIHSAGRWAAPTAITVAASSLDGRAAEHLRSSFDGALEAPRHRGLRAPALRRHPPEPAHRYSQVYSTPRAAAGAAATAARPPGCESVLAGELPLVSRTSAALRVAEVLVGQTRGRPAGHRSAFAASGALEARLVGLSSSSFTAAACVAAAPARTSAPAAAGIDSRGSARRGPNVARTAVPLVRASTRQAEHQRVLSATPTEAAHPRRKRI